MAQTLFIMTAMTPGICGNANEYCNKARATAFFQLRNNRRHSKPEVRNFGKLAELTQVTACRLLR
jgi:hypothetical protein